MGDMKHSELIELSELRIRNIILYKGELYYVSSLSLDIDDEYTDLIGVTPLGKTTGEKQDWNRAMFGDLQRASLTEEWLLKFGFEHENTIGGWSKWSNKKLKLLDMKFYFESSEYFVRIEYVHQLQNLYFVLTGEELELRQ